ncbi:MAG TPA: YeeE/YedE thiosulfate transporter family protein, partial [Solimonas sp.]|nr:YeeE/YedE thiosulfate transporter family protein [Solimonas sp.]
GERSWRLAFIVGLPLGAALFALLRGGLTVHLQTGLAGMLIGGLLVGFGTRLGNGCTSGHGVCGLARLSSRSLVAVLVFMGVAMLTVFVIRVSGAGA